MCAYTCSIIDVASEWKSNLEVEMMFIFLVYVAPIIRISGTTTKQRSVTSQQHTAAITIPAKKVAQLEVK